MGKVQKLLTAPLRKKPMQACLCCWYKKDYPDHNKKQRNERLAPFVGNGRKAFTDVIAMLDKVTVSKLYN